jgi:hypothetical protein
VEGVSRAKETIARIDALIESLADPNHRAMLSAFRTHWWSEVRGDIDMAMSVLPPDTIFKATGAVPSGNPFEVHTATEQRAVYQVQLDAGLTPAAGSFQNERWAFAEWGMMLEADWIFVLYGSMISGYGSFEADRLYWVEVPCVAVIPYRGDGMLGGEIFYIGNPVSITPTDRTMLNWLIAPPD